MSIASRDIRYGHFRLVEGNDRRGIDVAFAARRDLLGADEVMVTSHREASFGELGVLDREVAEALRHQRRRPRVQP